PSERLGLLPNHLQIFDVFALKGRAENEIVFDPSSLGSLIGEKLSATFRGIGVANDEPGRGHGGPRVRESRARDRRQRPSRDSDTTGQEDSQKSCQEPAPTQSFQ